MPGPRHPFAPFSSRRVTAGERRLAIYLLASFALHVAVLSLARAPRQAADAATPPMVVHILPVPDREPEVARVTPPSRLRTTSAEARKPHAALPRPEHEEATAALQTHDGGTEAERPQPSAATLEDSAQRIARQIGRDLGHRPPSAPPQERPILPELDRALARAVPGEQRLGQGIVKVTGRNGQVYCLKPPPQFGQETLTSSMYIPTTCP